MKRIITLLLSALLLTGLTACNISKLNEPVANIFNQDDEHVLMVKNGTSSKYPGKTWGEAFDSFFASPTWRYFRGTSEGPDEDGDGFPDHVTAECDVVEFTGYCTYMEQEVKALIQFTLYEDDTFEATYLSLNDVPQNEFYLISLIETAFEDGDASQIEEVTSAPVKENNSADSENVQVETTKPAKKECPYDYEQKLEVIADGSYADFTLYEWDGEWISIWTADGYVGEDGVSASNGENNCATPEGTFDIGFCYGLEKPNTKLKFIELNSDSIWVDDPYSDYYNCLTTYDKAYDASSYENTYSQFVNGYFSTNIYFENNGDGLTPGSAVSNKGSVITLCGYNGTLGPTAGCIDISSADMRTLLSKLDSSKSPVIEISSSNTVDTEPQDIFGYWEEENTMGYNKVYQMEITDLYNGQYSVGISFADSASSTSMYSFSGIMDSTGTINYTNGMYGIYTVLEDGTNHQSYKDSIHGTLTYKNGCFYWNCYYDSGEYTSIENIKFIVSD